VEGLLDAQLLNSLGKNEENTTEGGRREKGRASKKRNPGEESSKKTTKEKGPGKSFAGLKPQNATGRQA